ncbi:MAG: hypothetical protein HLUCCA13_13990 [Halomonas sp. HL-48]|nr:hypothetical protein [Halomonas sp. HL-48]KPQ23376.1 MAG: hypothetical protein HLUCCA13_13990 [Halomonas sp. HL-48]
MPHPMKREDFPVSNVRHFLEPGPVVLVSSQWQQQTNIMTLGWHMVMAFSPSLIGCVIDAVNHSNASILETQQITSLIHC